MKLRLLAVTLILLGLAGGYGLARLVTMPRFEPVPCPVCQKMDQVIPVVIMKSDYGYGWQMLHADRKQPRYPQAIAHFNSMPSQPSDCYCNRCQHAWQSGDK